MKIITKQRNQPHASRWYGVEVDHLDYYMVKDGQEYHLGGLTTGDISDFDKKRKKEEMEERIAQLKENDGKYFVFYCASGCLGTPNRFTDPFKFIEWIKENNYSFNDFFHMTQHGNYYEFGGNLCEYSAAFCFRIFDKDTFKEIGSAIKGIKITKE